MTIKMAVEKKGKNSICTTWTKRALDMLSIHVHSTSTLRTYNDDGFFVVPGLGNKYYCYHNPLSLLDNHDRFESKQYISEESEEIVTDMGQGKPSATQIQTSIFQSRGNLLSMSTINKITQYYSEGMINMMMNFMGYLKERSME